MMDDITATSEDVLWTFDPEFYHFGGGIPVSGELNCPHMTYCLVTANWRDATWNVERVMFTKHGNQMPQHITHLINYITKEATSHFMVIHGPREGKVIFNQMSLGLTGQHLNGVHPFDVSVFLKLLPLFLPSGLPDGVISFD
ncbi:hypothetical protein DSO57_1035717 [Entomophthora muscae]|uniref:Uncharacterized protein n=1 Tax=Entomophthora muscae TaxID=34485 RepID=A0ACC2S1K2_9FUNG|nr:hypothetical protein DSO57_1035717 [Entomophthora muscae]